MFPHLPLTCAAGLSGFAIFVALMGLFIALFMLLVPVIYEKYDKLTRLARALKEVRVGFILAGAGLSLTFLIRSVVQPCSGEKEPDDPLQLHHNHLG